MVSLKKYRDGHGLSNADAKEMLDSLLSDRDYNQIKRILENNPKTKQRKELLKKWIHHLINIESNDLKICKVSWIN